MKIQNAIKLVGRSGQIALGKEYAGRHVMVNEVEPGVWVIKLGRFIPDAERWLHEPDVGGALEKSIEWAEKNPPQESNLEELKEKIGE